MELLRVDRLPGKGYGAVATRDLHPGEVVICEEAGVIGPGSPEACLECVHLTSQTCSHCGFSLCENCKNSPQLCRHEEEECQILYRVQHGHDVDIPGLFNIVFPLRLLRLKNSQPDVYERLKALESHLEERKNQASPTRDSMIAMGKLLSLLIKVPAEEAFEAIAIQLTNGFEINLPSMSGRAVYPTISYLNHSCVPNITHSHKMIHKPGTLMSSETSVPRHRFFMELKVQRMVPTGAELTIRYNSVFEGYVKRQKTFSHDWFFHCECPRCSDPTEFGTFTSAVKCFQCSKGFVIPFPTLLNSGSSNKPLNDDGNDHHQRFYCSHCGAFCKFNFVDSVEQDVSIQMHQDFQSTDQMSELIRVCIATLHQQHYLVMMLKDNFVFRKTHDVALLEMQEEYARDVLQYLQILDPGNTWRKSQIMTRLRSIMTALAQKRTEVKNLDLAELKRVLREIQDLDRALTRLKS